MHIRSLFRTALALASLGLGTAALAQSVPAPATSAPMSVIIGGTVTDPSQTVPAQQDNVIGYGASVTGVLSNAYGFGASVVGSSSEAYGSMARADSDYAVAIGSQSHAGDPMNYPGNVPGGVVGGQTAIGTQSNATGGNSTAIGLASSASGSFSLALGSDASATGINAVALGAGTVADQDYTVAVGSRRIVGLAAGIDPYDAATIGQLSYLAAGFGGGASFSGGYFTAPTYQLFSPGAAGTYFNAGDAFTALDNGLSAVNTRIDNLPPAGDGGVGPAGPVGPKGDKGDKGDPGKDGVGNGTDAQAVHYDSPAQTDVTLQGQGGTSIHNLSAGVQNNDAANYGQVQQALDTAKQYSDAGDARTLDWAKAYTDMRLRNVNRRIAQATAVGSVMGVMALSAGSVPQQDKLSMGIAGSGGQSAIGIAFTHRFANNRVAVAVGGAFSSSMTALGASVSIGLNRD